MKSRIPSSRRALVALAAAWLSISAAASLGTLPIPTTLTDFREPGTQFDPPFAPIQPSPVCATCHGGYDPDAEPYAHWTNSLMAQSIRDPVFHAALAVANQDMANSGYLCLRCHAPGAWVQGRHAPDGSTLDPALGDLDGVNCAFCHRMVDPFYEVGVSPAIDERILDLLPAVPFSIGNGEYVVDPDDVRRGPYDLGPDFPLHDWLRSPFHRESLLCATCHEVSNPAFTRQPDGSYDLNPLGQQHPTHDKRDEFPIERTFSEWSQSVFAQVPIETEGRFGGNDPTVSTCQDCHMPKTTGLGCLPVLGAPLRDDLALHDFNGANSWVLAAVRNLHPDDETGLTAQSVREAQGRNAAMLRAAAELDLTVSGGSLGVRIVNRTGHKLPTGYGEGRRMWIHVKFLDADEEIVEERGAYDEATATLSTADTRVYEVKHGLDAEMAAIAGLPQGESFHFVLNNAVVLDNRIPPRGFSFHAFEAVQAEPVGATYGEQIYWGEVLFDVPPGAASAKVSLFHQTSSREYMEFLRDENATDDAGQIAYDQWVATGRSAPVEMATALIDLSAPPCPRPQPLGASTPLSDGTFPELRTTGSPTVSAGDFAIVVKRAIPGASAALYSSTATATTPFDGGILVLAEPLVLVAELVLDESGGARIPVPMTPDMVGTRRHYQVIYRDVDPPHATGLTNGLHVDFCP